MCSNILRYVSQLTSTFVAMPLVFRLYEVWFVCFRFIGELFKLQMLTTAIMYRCIEHLLSTPEEESLECLCKLLTTIGRDLENSSVQGNAKSGPVSIYLQSMALDTIMWLQMMMFDSSRVNIFITNSRVDSISFGLASFGRRMVRSATWDLNVVYI